MPAPLFAVILALAPAPDPDPDQGGFDYAAAIVAHIKLVTLGKSAEAVAYLNDHSNDPNIPPAQAEEMQRLLAGVYAASGKPEGLVLAGDRCSPRSRRSGRAGSR